MNKKSIAYFVGGALTGSILAGQVLAAQPHMQAALSNLKAAKQQLENAKPDKAGHRVKAIALTEDAIKETQLGIAAGAN